MPAFASCRVDCEAATEYPDSTHKWESVQLLFLLQQQISLSPTFPNSQFSRDPGLCVVAFCPANKVDLAGQQFSYWRIFVDIFIAASRNTHTQTHVANYLVCVCLAVLRSTTIGTGKLTPNLALPLTKYSQQSFISNKISD